MRRITRHHELAPGTSHSHRSFSNSKVFIASYFYKLVHYAFASVGFRKLWHWFV
jgi:hypothetical protein